MGLTVVLANDAAHEAALEDPLVAALLALATARDEAEIAHILVRHGVGALRAKSCTFARASEDASALQIVMTHGVADDVMRQFRSMPLAMANAMTDAVRQREPIILRSHAERVARYPHLRSAADAVGPAMVAALPLLVGQRALGAVSFTFDPDRDFSDHTGAVLVALAGQCAQALDRVRLEQAERDARADAELVHDLAVAASRAETLEEVYEPALTAIRLALRVERASVLLFDPDGVMRFKAHRGLSDAYRAAVEGHTPWKEDDGDAQPILVDDVAREPSLAAYRATFEAEGIRSLGFIPLLHRKRVLGKFMIYDDEPRAFSRRDVRLASTVAGTIAQAVVHARLLEDRLRAIQIRDDFLAMAGHELRTPLTTILLLSHNLGPAMPVDAIATRAERIRKQAVRMGLLADQLLDVSRFASGRVTLEREDVDLAAVVREVAARAADQAGHVGCALSVDAPGPLVGSWDPGRLEIVASNLVTNALKYARGAPVDVTVARKGDTAHLVVRDRGMGIAAADQARIFERFERAAPPGHGGLGLGLWIVRQIIEAHGGSVAVRSEPGHGAEFEITLPLRPT